MKIFLTLLIACVLAACGTATVPEEVEDSDFSEQSTEDAGYSEEYTENSEQLMLELDAADMEIYPVLVYSHGMHYGYIVGGVVNHKFISLEENLNQLSLSADSTYSFFANESKILDVKCESVRTTHVDATGTDEIVVEFGNNEIETGMKYCSVGIGNLRQPLAETKIVTIDATGTFEIDFDGDGKIEKLIISKYNNDVSVSLENQDGITMLAKFTVDEIYTSAFEIFAADVTQNGNQELLICLDGHDYSTEVFAITSYSSEKVLGYYMGN